MSAKTTAKLLQGHNAALAAGDAALAQEFADAATKYALYWTSGVPMLQNAPAAPKRKRAPSKKRKRAGKGSAPAAISHAPAHRTAKQENIALSAFVGLSAVACLLALFFANYHPKPAHGAAVNSPHTLSRQEH